VISQTPLKPLSQSDVLQLLQRDVSPKRVADLAKEHGITFQISPEVETELRQAGATEELLATLRELAPKPPTVLIRSSPGAFVYVESQFQGLIKPEGQLRVQLPAGPHSIRVSHPGYKDYVQQLELRTGQEIEIPADLKLDTPPVTPPTTNPNPAPRSGVELVADGASPVIRFPVSHVHALSGCVGYLYFSQTDIRYEMGYAISSQKENHSFRYLRSDLRRAKEYYASTRLEFSDGHNYTFYHDRRLPLPPDDLVNAANEFDKTVTALQSRRPQNKAYSGVPESALLEAGEVLVTNVGPILRFAVAHEGKNWFSSYGYLVFSKDSIRYDVTYGPTAESFNYSRSSLTKAKSHSMFYGGEAMTVAEFEFSAGKHRFRQYLAEQNRGPTFNLRADYRELLEAANNFPAAVAKAQAAH